MTSGFTIPLVGWDQLRGDRRSLRRELAGALAASGLVRIRPGVYVDAAQWDQLQPEQQIVARGRALHRIAKHPPVFCGPTAAALHALPVVRSDATRVHVTSGDPRTGSVLGVVRHRGTIPADELVMINGLQCTSLDRTLSDIARRELPETSLPMLDAALRSAATARHGSYDVDTADAVRDRILAIAGRSSRGNSRAAMMVAFADGRAQSPGESISRWHLNALGFRRLSLQVPVPAPHGGFYYLDLGLDDVHAFGEFDGLSKYRDPELMDGRDTAAILLDEKRREDWIRGTTHRKLARWGWAHLRTAQALGDRLAAFHILPPN